MEPISNLIEDNIKFKANKNKNPLELINRFKDKIKLHANRN